MKPLFTAIIEKEDDMFVALCPELDIASQGYSVEEAKVNLKEAVELFLEYASETELKRKLHCYPSQIGICERENRITYNIS